MTPQPNHPIALQLAFAPLADNPADPATMGEVTRDVVAGLQQAGYTVQPAYTGTRGGDLFEILHQVGQHIVEHKDLLIALLTPVPPIVDYLLKERDRRAKQEGARQQPPTPIKVSIEVDGAAITVEAPDVESATKLAEQFRRQHPDAAERVTTKSTVKVVGNVAAKPARRRR